MKTEKITLLIILIALHFCTTKAQNIPNFHPFKGFHVGVTGQAEFIQKCTFVALTGTDPAPRSRWTYGWETGIEFSYHFAKHFGISLGINFGTIVSFNYDIFLSTVPDFQGGWKEENKYDPNPEDTHNCELLFPIKFEFNYPLSKSFFLGTEIGIKIKGIRPYNTIGKESLLLYHHNYFYLIENPSASGSTYEQIMYFEAFGVRDVYKIRFDLLLGIGLYYNLPYGDLLRFTTGVNISFNPIVEGYYVYFLTDSYGTFSVKNDFIYTQLSYIHTFNYQKTKKYLKKQDFSFSSKKERRKKIIEMLNVW